MSLRRLAVLTLGLWVSAGCGPAAEDEVPPDVRARFDAIVGGTATTGDTNVFMLFMQGDNGQGSMCTATLIDRRTLMTASHCVDPRVMGANSVAIWAHNKPTEGQALQSDYIRLVETRMHPSWNPNSGLDNDIAMAFLERAPSVTPKPWNKQSLTGMTGFAVRAVGYGISDPAGPGGGIKRTVDLTITQLMPGLLRLGNGSNKGVCQGDSGGPTFMTLGGVEKVVGVHSFTSNQSCTDGADTRVDAYQSFVQQWLNERESPTCGEDGRCASGCTPVDIDCVCPADGQCTTACPVLTKDPDCPKDCVADGVCSLATCPAPDTDCLPLGQPCASANQCPGRLCISDVLHPAPYCSRPCSVDADCGNGLTCDASAKMCLWPQVPPAKENDACTPGQTYCAPPLVCEGAAAGSTTCRKACVLDTDCKTGEACTTGTAGRKYCAPPRPIILLKAHADGTVVPGGCAAVPWPAPALVLGLLGLLRRRRV